MYTMPKGKYDQVIWQQNFGLWNNSQSFVNAELFQDNQKIVAMLCMITQVQSTKSKLNKELYVVEREREMM